MQDKGNAREDNPAKSRVVYYLLYGVQYRALENLFNKITSLKLL